MVRNVSNAWDYVPKKGEVNDKRKFGYFCETIGYVPVAKQVSSFFRAGQIIADNDSYYDTTEDDPKDDPVLNVRDWELEDVGHEMTRLQQTMTDSAEQAKNASKAEASKNVITGTKEGTSEEKSE